MSGSAFPPAPLTAPTGCVALLIKRQPNEQNPCMLVCLVTFEHRQLRCALVSQLRIEDLQRALVAPAGPFAALDVVSSTGSTNADLMDAAGTGGRPRAASLF